MMDYKSRRSRGLLWRPRSMTVRLLLLLVIFCFSCFTVLGVPLNDEAPARRADPVTTDPAAPLPPPCVLTTNGDISGIGVRISFYAQSLIGILAPRILDREDTGNIFRNALLTSVALEISTLIQKGKPGVLSVVDGLLATFFPFLLTIGTTYHMFTLLRSNTLVKISYLLQVIVVNVFALIFWVHVHTFGSFEGCNINSTAQFVLFGHSFSVTSKGLRIFCIVTSALALDPLVLACLPFMGPDDEDDSLEDDEDFRIVAWLWTCVPLAAWIYTVVTIEQIIRRNGLANAANQWTYGQTLSVVLLVNTIVDVTVAGFRKKNKKKESSTTSKVAENAEKAENAGTKVEEVADAKADTKTEAVEAHLR